VRIGGGGALGEAIFAGIFLPFVTYVKAESKPLSTDIRNVPILTTLEMSLFLSK